MRSMCTSTRKLRLRRAEAAERAVRRRVRAHRACRGCARSGTRYGPDRVDDAARQHDRAERAVRAGIEHDVDVHGDKAAVARDPGAMADDRRMALRRRQHVLDAVVDQLHRRPRLARQQRRVARDVRRDILPCRRIRRRSPSARRARDRPAARAARSARGARSTGTAAIRRPSCHRLRARQSRRWSRCRAAPDARFDTRLRRRRRLRRIHRRSMPLSIAIDLKTAVRSLGIEERRLRRVVDRAHCAASRRSRSACASSRIGSAT